jgi:hypothetical protein
LTASRCLRSVSRVSTTASTRATQLPTNDVVIDDTGCSPHVRHPVCQNNGPWRRTSHSRQRCSRQYTKAQDPKTPEAHGGPRGWRGPGLHQHRLPTHHPGPMPPVHMGPWAHGHTRVLVTLWNTRCGWQGVWTRSPRSVDFAGICCAFKGDRGPSIRKMFCLSSAAALLLVATLCVAPPWAGAHGFPVRHGCGGGLAACAPACECGCGYRGQGAGQHWLASVEALAMNLDSQ